MVLLPANDTTKLQVEPGFKILPAFGEIGVLQEQEKSLVIVDSFNQQTHI